PGDCHPEWSGLESLGRQHDEAELSSDDVEVATVEREDLAAVPLGARGDEGVGRAEGEVVVARDQLTHPRDVALAAVELQLASLDAAEEAVEGGRRQTALGVPPDLVQHGRRDVVGP